jgi:hypothetical protein
MHAHNPEVSTPRSPRPWRWFVVLALLATLIVIAHGCHGPDVDDELLLRPWLRPAPVDGR